MFSPTRLLLLCLLLVPVAAHAAEEDETPAKLTPRMAYIADAITDARSRIKTLQATVKYYEFSPKEITSAFKELYPKSELPDAYVAVDEEKIWQTQFWVTPEIYRGDVYHIKDSPGMTQNKRHFVSRLEDSAILDFWYIPNEMGEMVVDESRTQSSIMTRKMGFGGGISGDILENDPRRLAYPAGSTFFIDDRIRIEQNPTTYLGEVELDGLPCFQFELVNTSGKRIVHWIDKKHSFIARRVEALEKIGEVWVPMYVRQVSRVQESNGIWLPAEVEIRSSMTLIPPYQKGGKNYGKLPPGISRDKVQTVNGVLLIPGTIYRYTVENLVVNAPIASKLLELPYPPNFKAYNRITQKLVTMNPTDTTVPPGKPASTEPKKE